MIWVCEGGDSLAASPRWFGFVVFNSLSWKRRRKLKICESQTSRSGSGPDSGPGPSSGPGSDDPAAPPSPVSLPAEVHEKLSAVPLCGIY